MSTIVIECTCLSSPPLYTHTLSVWDHSSVLPSPTRDQPIHTASGNPRKRPPLDIHMYTQRLPANYSFFEGITCTRTYQRIYHRLRPTQPTNLPSTQPKRNETKQNCPPKSSQPHTTHVSFLNHKPTHAQSVSTVTHLKIQQYVYSFPWLHSMSVGAQEWIPAFSHFPGGSGLQFITYTHA